MNIFTDVILVSSILISFSYSMKPSKIHMIKLTSTPYYTLSCNPTSGTCKYISMPDPQQSRKLAMQFSLQDGGRENIRSKGGRKIMSSSSFDKISELMKKVKSKPKVNIIPYGETEHQSMTEVKANKHSDMTTENEIFRPKLKFVSNARPAVLKWRELEMEKTPIIKPHRQNNYKSRRNKKYHNKEPVHFAKSRTLVRARDSPLPNIFQQRSMSHPDSSISRLASPSFVNGLQKTIYHFKYPLKTREIIYANGFSEHEDKKDNKYNFNKLISNIL